MKEIEPLCSVAWHQAMSKVERKLAFAIIGVLASEPILWLAKATLPYLAGSAAGLILKSESISRLVHISEFFELTIVTILAFILVAPFMIGGYLLVIVVAGKGSLRAGNRWVIKRATFARGGSGGDFAAWLLGLGAGFLMALPDVVGITRYSAWLLLAIGLTLMLLVRLAWGWLVRWKQRTRHRQHGHEHHASGGPNLGWAQQLTDCLRETIMSEEHLGRSGKTGRQSASPWNVLTEFIAKLKGSFDSEGEIPPSAAVIEKWMSGDVFFSEEELGGVLLGGEDAQEYRACVEGIYKVVAGKQGHISVGTVEVAIQSAILKALNITKQDSEPDFSARLTREIGVLKETLRRKPESHMVRLEVQGLDPNDLPRQMGDVKFYVADETSVPEAVTSEKDATNEADKKRREGARVLRNNIINSMRGRTYVAMEIQASDLKAAEFLAERQLRRTVDVLNYFGDFFSHGRARVFLPGDAAPCKHIAVVGKKGEPEKNKFMMSRKGPLVRFSFPSPSAPSIAVRAFTKASALLQKQNRNPLEKRILAALQWAGRASVEERQEEAFLLYCISLDALLLKNEDKGEIAFSFALRGAHLLLRDSDKRMEIFRDLKALYRLRSKVVHSGETEISDSELAQIRGLAKQAIFTVLTSEPFSSFTMEEQLEDWFQDQLLAGGTVATTGNPTPVAPTQLDGTEAVKSSTEG